MCQQIVVHVHDSQLWLLTMVGYADGKSWA